MFGDGLTHGSPVSSNHCRRSQPSSGTTVSFTGILRSAAAMRANSPIVMPVRTGIGCGPVNDVRSASSSGPFDDAARDRVGPVEHDDRQVELRRLLHRVLERREVRVVARADVLHVEDDRG